MVVLCSWMFIISVGRQVVRCVNWLNLSFPGVFGYYQLLEKVLWLHVIFMSRTSFRVNLHTIFFLNVQEEKTILNFTLTCFFLSFKIKPSDRNRPTIILLALCIGKSYYTGGKKFFTTIFNLIIKVEFFK